MDNWRRHLKHAFSRRFPRDPIDPIAPQRSGLKHGKRLANLYPFALKHRNKGLLGVVLIAATSLMSFPQPLITKYLIDDVILAGKPALLLFPLALLVAVSLTAAVMDFFKQLYLTRFEQFVILDIQNSLLARALNFPKAFFDRSETGYIVSRLTSDVQGLSWFFSGSIANLLEDVVRLSGGLILLFYLEWRLALLALLVIPGIAFLMRFFSIIIYVLSHDAMERHAHVLSRFQEAISSISLIKAFSAESRTVRNLSSELQAAQDIRLQQTLVGSIAQFAVRSIPGAARVAVIALGAYWIISGQWSLGALIAFQVYLGYVFGPAQSLASANLDLQHARASLERVSALFDILPEDNTGTGRRVEKLTGDIEFRNVSFSYHGTDPILDDISLRIRPGQRVALMGPSGIGKTTLLSLLLRFYRPQRGEIYFDGQPLSELDIGSLRSRIGYVSQSENLLSGTVQENLLYGNPDASEGDMIRAAKTAGIHDFIRGLKEGYRSKVEEKGHNFSEGQKQRLAIARALIRDPDILLLDEPSSALDRLSEESLLQMLPDSMKGKTIFIITHHIRVARDSDLILLLNEDRLIAAGTHESLKSDSTYYRQMLDKEGF